MITDIAMGGSRQFALQHALMIYSPPTAWGGLGGGEAYVTLHDVEHQEDGPPQLGPGRPADLGFLRALTEGLQANVPAEILPPHVLCRTPDTIVWWSAAQVRPMFFSESSDLGEISGKAFPQPALVWKIVGQHIYVRAMATSERPTAEAPLYQAPYWNTNPDGRICLGSMKRPGAVEVGSLRAWEDGYFGSLFTGQNGRGDRVEGGIVGLWKSLAGENDFPDERLIDAGETLEAFVRGGGRA